MRTAVTHYQEKGKEKTNIPAGLYPAGMFVFSPPPLKYVTKMKLPETDLRQSFWEERRTYAVVGATFPSGRVSTSTPFFQGVPIHCSR